MSYDLDALAPDDAPPARAPLEALVAVARAGVPALARAAVRGERAAACDGEGFALEGTLRGARLSAGGARGGADEWLMERVALAIAGPRGEVLDRHTGRRWPAAVLGEWLAITGLLSGRALAANEARIARQSAVGSTALALQGFAERIDRVSQRVARGEASPALAGVLRDELTHYATRRSFAWTVARGLAVLGDFSRLEALAHASTAAGVTGVARDGEPDAFAIAAEHGAACVPLFARALADEDPNHRRAAARALHRVRAPEVLPLVAAALEDRRSTVREAVLEAGFDELLALEGAAHALAPLLTRLEHDPSSLVRRLAARARK